METRADEMLGPVSGNEYDLLLSKLAGARGNRVFSFFGIEAPQRAAETLLAVQKVGGKAGDTGGVTTTLEKKNKKRGLWPWRSETLEASRVPDFLAPSQCWGV